MKRLISLLFLFIAAFNISFAQRLNNKGQQMVKSIKVYNEENKLKYTYSFFYDEKDKLIKMTNYGSSFNYEIWFENGTFHKKIEGNLKDGTWSKYMKYFYKVDNNRNILKKISKCYDIYMVGYERWDYDYTYGYPASDTIYQVTKQEISYIPIEVIKGKAVPQYKYTETSYYDFLFECGNEHRFLEGINGMDGRFNSYHKEEGGFENYTSYRNMTNLNMNYVLFLGYMNSEEAECATEWCNHFSFCLPEGIGGNYFEYHFRDKEPYTLYEVDDYYGNGALRWKFVLEYVD